MQDFNHKHIVLTALVLAPPVTTDALNEWFEDAVRAVGMRMLMPPRSVFCDTPGNIGVTGTCAIETSHLAAHCWQEAPVPFLNADLYSCKDFDPDAVIATLGRFEAVSVSFAVIDRNKEAKIVLRDTRQIRPLVSFLTEADHELYNQSQRIRPPERNAGHRRVRAEYARISRLYSLAERGRMGRSRREHHMTLNVIKQRARAKGLPFDLDAEWYAAELLTAKARWPELIAHGRSLTFWSATVDRIVPIEGYLKSNCRIIPHALNMAKNAWAPEQVRILSRMLSLECGGSSLT